ncbi:methyltransferase family protein [Paenibacillus cellulosilyticus]|uniref:Methyltransferase family protein n=1 Tax=Paenibacillus cellulosilyticus TaxID=375489 RepID=A0A2V2YXU4_9BACL|nr:class I SAM-dependent methyltransferase [Paenibacillus cellulosilyticus]PWW05710.1 methyltransferase family protein [Paenibacillus cellulosilyticus]QKS45272.1 class I SAM-dependent methyltransferase [Paenibacillus cellulosilyticus]
MNTDPVWKTSSSKADVQHKDADAADNRFEFTLPSAWLGRQEPNAWAGLFVHSGSVKLDAVPGMSHTFHVMTQAASNQDHEIDETSPRIVSLQSIVRRLDKSESEHTETETPLQQLDCLRFVQADIAKLPYEDGKYDIVFGLSVLHRLNTEDAQEALDEFLRVLKMSGLLVLTFDESFSDFPTFARMVRACGFSFAGEFDSYLPDEAHKPGAKGRLYAFRAEETFPS